MSDGDNATPGRGDRSGPSGDDPRLLTVPASAAAPWERMRTPANGTADSHRPTRASRRRSGATGGVSVADLIARVNADDPAVTTGRRRALSVPDDSDPAPIALLEPEPRLELETADRSGIWPPGDIAEVAAPSELPDLDLIHHVDEPGYAEYDTEYDYTDSGYEAQTTTLPPLLDDDTDYDESDYDESDYGDDADYDYGDDAQTTALPPILDDIPPVPIGPLDYPDDDHPEPDRDRRPGKAGRRHRRLLIAGRTLAALIAICALVLTGGAWQWSAQKNRNLKQVSALDLGSNDIVDPGGQNGDENFLIVGADTRAGANSEVGAGDTDDAGGARSDTIMLVNIPANRKRVVVVSFPRDLAITPIECTRWNPDTGEYGPLYDSDSGSYTDRTAYTTTKLNSTYAFGGPLCLVKEIQKLSGLAINRFMAVDFVGFDQIVDTLGGVEVCTTYPLWDEELGTVLDQTGRQTINGTTALNYVRARSIPAEGNGDYGRIKRQQRFLSSLLRSLISANTFLSPSKLNAVVNLFIVHTTVDGVQTKDLVNLGQSMQNISAGHVTFVTIPTGVTDENGDEPPRVDDMHALFDAIINDDPLPQENDHNATSTPTSTASPSTRASSTPTTAPTSAAPAPPQSRKITTAAPADVTVRVSNGTDRSGLASTAADEFEKAGFTVTSPDDYSGSLATTTVLYSPGNEQAAATVAAALGGAPLQRATGLGQTVRVVLGTDFHAVGKPLPAGTKVEVQISQPAGAEPTQLPEDLTITNAADTTCE